MYARLCWAAYRDGNAARRADYLLLADLDAALDSKTPQLPYGHPDLLVQRAAALRVIDGDDADLFIQVRLAHRAIEPIAAARDTLRRRLDRATARLADALAVGLLTMVVSTETAAALTRQAELHAGIRAAKGARTGLGPSQHSDSQATSRPTAA